MSKVVKMVAMALILTVILTLGVAGAVFADDPGPGPAPGSGDCNPDGPEWVERPDGSGPGPAPASGDGVPDGPGW